MGESDAKRDDFHGYTITADILDATDAALLHCLPANRGEEVTEAAIEHDNALVWQQAQNRLHVQKALLAHLLE
jgi:ornithine carbamoyltransferase